MDNVSKRIKKAVSEYSEKHSLYSKKGFEHNKTTNSKHKALNKKSGHGEYSNISFTPKNKSEERAFNKYFRSKTG